MGLSDEQDQTLLRVTNAVVSCVGQEELFKAVATALSRLYLFERASLCLYDADKDAFRLVALLSEGKSDVGKGTLIPHINSSRVWIAVETGRPYYRPDLSRKPLFFEDPPLLKEEMHSGLVIPMIVRGQPVGTFNVNTRRTAPFSDADIEFLARVTNLLAVSIANAQAQQKLAALKDQLQRESAYWREETKGGREAEEIAAHLPSLAQLMDRIRTVAKTNCTVLITGETGVGKETIARALHNQSPRRLKPFVKVDCASLPLSLIESEIFGHEKGAFTDAYQRKLGRFELAHEGTLFLDEIGELPINTQVKLLRFLQEKAFERLGGNQTITIDARVIVATNQNLRGMILTGRFREDLFYRINVSPVHLKPLRERPEDIPPLVEYFVQKHSRRVGKQVPPVDQRTMDFLCRSPWPGNIRELENTVEQAVIISTEGRLVFELEGLSPSGPQGEPLKPLAEVEKEHILCVLGHTGGVIDGDKGAARILGLHPNTLRSRMQRLGILFTHPRQRSNHEGAS